MAEPTDLKYTKEHEWVLVEGDVATIGITAYAADQLGDIVFVDLPAVGSRVESGRVVGEIESTKSVGELYAPVAGEIVEANDAVAASPELLNSDPLGDGWLIKVRFDALPELLDLDAYTALTA
ncbi:glycine cleavage system H protein [Diaminobutyricimonas aerilata]|uniref:Glycine cleavage system H protein n=1 Tax=Diaminobutyricimonas aerilata TaxID=1162967 RepID=A0A2M9CI48_9MICO|nr:glycine cleavage system protein GcvH [Diaminobutyricimonas aerilata]PJJ71558.1 glycine cleavage system H protein [Diaminobutyricimonas aerilata]